MKTKMTDELNVRRVRGVWLTLMLIVTASLALSFSSCNLSGSEDKEKSVFLERCVEQRPEAACKRMVDTYHSQCFEIGQSQDTKRPCGIGFERTSYHDCLRYGPSRWRRKLRQKQNRAREKREDLGMPSRPGEGV